MLIFLLESAFVLTFCVFGSHTRTSYITTVAKIGVKKKSLINKDVKDLTNVKAAHTTTS